MRSDRGRDNAGGRRARRAAGARYESFADKDAALAYSREHYVDLYDFAPIGYLTLDEGGRILGVNLAAAKLLACPRDRLLGRSLAPFIAAEDRHLFRQHVSRAASGDTEARCEVTVAPPKGKLVEVQLYTVGGGRRVDDGAYQTAIVDITALRQRERELTRTAEQLRDLTYKLGRAEQDERRRLAKVLHDGLQQLLTAAGFTLAALRRHVDGGEAERLIDNLNEQLTQSADMARTLSHELSPGSLHDVGLQAALRDMATNMARNHGLNVAVRAAGVDPLPEGVRVFAFAAIRELLFNVVKHARTTQAHVNARRTRDGLRLSVSDNGVGIDPQARIDASLAQDGLGLYRIREQVEYLGGRLRIESRPNRGSRFVLHVPAAACRLPASRRP